MEADYGIPARGRDDPRHDEGLAHLQAGDWTAAVRCFEELAERYPGDPDVARSLEQAQFHRGSTGRRASGRRASPFIGVGSFDA